MGVSAFGLSVASSSKRKGDRGELEVQAILRELLGVPARRALGAGRRDDVGDITGVPNTVIQVADWKDVLRAVREKPLQCEEQRLRSKNGVEWRDMSPFVRHAVDVPCPFAATFIRLRGPVWRVVQTPEQWCAMWRETL